jgi:hypothetical protein
MEPGTGERGGKYMKRRIIDPDMPIGKLTPVKDFLPPPSELVFPSPSVKVTIYLSQDSLTFFKRAAKKNHTKYQRMIRAVIDHYAAHFSEIK